MKSIPPKTEAVDDAWAAGGEGEADFDLAGLFAESAPAPPPRPASTAPAADGGGDDFALVDLGELFIEDHTNRPTPVPGVGDDASAPPRSDEPSGAPAKSSKSTLRPPQPEAEYVADMMERALSPWPAPGSASVEVDPVPVAPVPGFGADESFDFGELEAGPGTVPYGTIPPPARPTPAASKVERPTRPSDVSGVLGADLDMELDRALGSTAPATMPSVRESEPPQTQRGLGDSSVPPAGATPPGMDAVEILEFGPPTPPPPSAPTPPPMRAAPRLAGTSAPPPRLAPRPRSGAGVRGTERASSVDETPSPPDSSRRGAVARRSTPPAPRPRDPLRLVKDRFELGDYSGALVQAEAVLEDRPTDPEALRYADACRAQLLQMYLSRIGDRTQVPRVVMEQDQLRWLSLDHRAGFLLAVIDGATSIDDILDVSGMTELDTLRILYDFVLQGVIQMGPQRRRWR